ncbi:MAG: S9 family peptidase, partial [Bryobacteraceae bacterium]
ASFAFSRDGKWLAYRSGRGETGQIHLYDMAKDKAEALTKHSTGVGTFAWAPDSSRIYFTAADERDEWERRRMDLKFDVRLVDAPRQAEHLWEVALDKNEKRLTSGDFSVRRFNVSRDGAWIGLSGGTLDRHWGGLDGSQRADAYLLETATAKLERLTDNQVPESPPQVSPDGRLVMFTSTEDFAPFRRSRAYVRPVRGGQFKKLAGGSDEETSSAVSWSRDSRRLYFTNGRGLNTHLFAQDVDSGTLKQLTDRSGGLAAAYHADSDLFVLTADSPSRPRDYYVSGVEDLGSEARWRRMSDANPQVADMDLGAYEAVRWKSSDGQMVEGILVKPLGYKEGQKVPLIVQVHGGPAGAYINNFSGGYGTYVHVFAAGGYAVFQPNYRGSTNYGEKFRMEISGDYFRQG